MRTTKNQSQIDLFPQLQTNCLPQAADNQSKLWKRLEMVLHHTFTPHASTNDKTCCSVAVLARMK
jgi:DNA/RNA endonuclease G (NUC1)